MAPELVKAVELFFVPSVILFGLGVTSSEGLKTAVSALGFYLSIAWLMGTLEAYFHLSEASSLSEKTLTSLPVVFACAWGCSTLLNGKRWLCAKRSECESF